MSNNTEKPDGAIDPVARYESPFNREALRSVYEVNELFLSWLMRANDLTEFERGIQSQLAGMSADSLELAADCPFLLVDAKFQDSRAWRQALVQFGSDPPPNTSDTERHDPSRVGLARSTFFAAWYIVHRWPSSAEILVGATKEVIASFSGIELTRLASLAESRTGWITPRWPDRPDVWAQLLVAATNASQGESPSLRQRALQLLLGRLLG